ncbi:hypothetical protein [Bacillus licheniformis]|uniref:hypothetical protein n=1 Tax=Bacillus licheniformis TaxID=1402 RepID=UPI00211BA6D6|nr:hypothetical protein [Bacillus licheniformis]
MKKRTVLFFLLIWLAGCASAQEAEEQTKWVNSEQKAIENGIRYESITKDDIIDKIDLNGEQVVVFRFGDSEGEGIGLAHIKREKRQLSMVPRLKLRNCKIGPPENGECGSFRAVHNP